VDSFELDLNVKGFTSLDESLNNYLSEEISHGDNQWIVSFFCGYPAWKFLMKRSTTCWPLRIGNCKFMRIPRFVGVTLNKSHGNKLFFFQLIFAFGEITFYM
jgi:hypothetical protein